MSARQEALWGGEMLRHYTIGAAAAALVTTPSSVALAQSQTTASTISEVVVTARKREENLQQIPVAVTALSSRQLTQQGVRTPTDLQRYVPSLQSTTNLTAPAAVTFGLRGQVAGDLLLTQSPAVGLYEDSANIPHPEGTDLSLYDIDRIEVLKGPQGTLYGRNTTGGAVNIVTRNANHNGVHGYVTGELGDYSNKKLTGAINVPVIKDVLSVRLAGQWWKRDGIGHSLTTGQKIGKDHDDRSLRLSVRFDPTDNFTSTTKIEWSKTNRNGELFNIREFNPLAGLPAGVRAAKTTDIFTNSDDLIQDYPLTAWHAVQDMTWDITDKVRLRSITGYHKVRDFHTLDFDTSSVLYLHQNGGSQLLKTIPPFSDHSGFGNHPDQESESFTQEFDLSGHAFDRWDWLVGVFGSTDDGQATQVSNFNFGQGLLSGVYVPDIYQASWGIYTQNDVHLTDRMSLTLGARYSEERLKMTGWNVAYNETQGAATGRGYICNGTVGQLLGAPHPPFVASLSSCAGITSREVSSGISYLASFNFQITPDNLLYVSTSRGTRGGALQQRSLDAPPANPETAINYEIGMKNEFFDRRMRLNFAYYHTKYKNKQESSVVQIGGAPRTLLTNAADAKIDGFEAEVNVVPTAGWTVYGNMAYINGRYDRFVCAVPIFVPGPNAACPASPTGTVDASGTDFITNPKWQYSLGTRYEHEIGPGLLGGQLDWSWRKQAPTTVLNADPLNQRLLDSINGNVGLLNARIDYALPDHGVTVALFATNLANKHYASVGTSDLYYSFGLLFATAQEPRMWGIQVTKKFGAE